jgi:cytochrome c oxidase subunit 2
MRRRWLLLALASSACRATPVGPEGRVIAVTARKFEYAPARVVVRRGAPVVLELTTLDRKHGFKVPDLGLRADILPGETTRLAFTPLESGTFVFACDRFCGDGHEDMAGELVVEP